MNKRCSIWLSWLMTVCIVVSTAGIPLSKHVCFLSGKVDVQLGQQTLCCGETNDFSTHHQESLKVKCCELSLTYQRVEQPASGFDKVELQKVVALLPLTSPLPFPGDSQFNRLPSKLLVQCQPVASPLYGRELLVRLQTFLI